MKTNRFTLLIMFAGCFSAAAQEKEPPVLVVTTEEGGTVPLTAQDWAKLTRTKAQVKEKDGKEATFAGVSLVEVLRSAGVPFGEHLRGPRVANYVVVEAADGYRATFALAEIDPSTSDKLILLVDRREGEALAKESGPLRLIVPGDKIHSRWVRQVNWISVLKPPAAKGEKK
jgi:hypothetical protein